MTPFSGQSPKVGAVSFRNGDGRESEEAESLSGIQGEERWTPLFDYWAAQLPVIATTPGEIGELIGKAGGGRVVAPENAQELAAIIRTYADSPELMQMEGKAGHDFVAAEFSREALAKTLSDGIKELIL